MFKGFYEHTLDAKGRLSIPSRFRDVLAQHREEVFILTNFKDRLVGYPSDEWELLEEKVRGFSLFNGPAQDFVRLFVSGAQECPVDKQGRILVPPGLREKAALEKDVVLLGLVNRVEIWSKPNWDAYHREKMENFDATVAQLSGLGL